MRVISLGWGVQSFTLAAMTALGELPPVDAAIHADTEHEHAATYEFARAWTPWLEDHGVRVVTVKGKSTQDIINPAINSIDIPAYVTRPDGTHPGILRRQCTDDWKIAPMYRWLKSNRERKRVTMLIGISLDESHRMKPSRVEYVVNEWPLIDKRMNRHACKQWLVDKGLPIPPRSSCVFCPYQSRREWKAMFDERGADWEHAVEVDKLIRHKRKGFVCYLIQNLKPLEEAFKADAMYQQIDMFSEECTGMCFL